MLIKLALVVALCGFLADDSAVPKSETPASSQAAAASGPESKDAKSSDKSNLIEVEKQIIEQTNAQRAKFGLPALAVDQGLVQSARTHTAWMTNNHTLQHTTKNVGENIAMGQRTTDEAVNDWMNSPGHRANILNGGYKRIGVAAYRADDGTIFWCQEFLP